jgi:hypothetical protein
MHKLGERRGAPSWLSYGHDYAREDEQSCGPQETNSIPRATPVIKVKLGRRILPHKTS